MPTVGRGVRPLGSGGVSRSVTSHGSPVKTQDSLADKVLWIFVKVWIVSCSYEMSLVQLIIDIFCVVRPILL